LHIGLGSLGLTGCATGRLACTPMHIRAEYHRDTVYDCKSGQTYYFVQGSAGAWIPVKRLRHDLGWDRHKGDDEFSVVIEFDGQIGYSRVPFEKYLSVVPFHPPHLERGTMRDGTTRMRMQTWVLHPPFCGVPNLRIVVIYAATDSGWKGRRRFWRR
jgi:hypothetical protein